jgi:hypothetical protein
MNQRFWLCIAFILYFQYGYAQKTVFQEIFNIKAKPLFGETSLNAKYSVDDNNLKTLEYLIIFGQDSRYKYASSPISIFSGSPNKCLSWINRLINVSENEESGTLLSVDSQSILVLEGRGEKILNVHEKNGGDGYHRVTKKRLINLKSALEKWMNENKSFLNETSAKSDSSIISKPKNIDRLKPDFVADELIKLKSLMDQGVLTKEEFEAQKKKLLGN